MCCVTECLFFLPLVGCLGSGLLCVRDVHSEARLQRQGHELTGVSHRRGKGFKFFIGFSIMSKLKKDFRYNKSYFYTHLNYNKDS